MAGPASGPDAVRGSVGALHRGGAGEPLVLLHGFGGSWRIWRPVLEGLERRHDVIAPTLIGHRGGPPLPPGSAVTLELLADGVEACLDGLGVATAHIAGNSLGGWLAIELGRRGRARSITALSPAGGWRDARDLKRLIRLLEAARVAIRRSPPGLLRELLARPRGRRLAFRQTLERGDRIPPAEVAGMLYDVLGCEIYDAFLDYSRRASPIARARVAAAYPMRIAWAANDRTLPFRAYGRPVLEAIPEADHLTLAGVGHVPMYDDPELVTTTILELTTNTTPQERR